MQIINNTALPLEEIKRLPLVGLCKNKWRMRDVEIYQHPTDPNSVYSVGVNFDKKKTIICLESRKEHMWALNSFPRVYIHE
jgi:hypothetical protein